MIGQTVGRYQIVEKIGAGGMGVVYRATDAALGRDVALKILPAAFVADTERMARFEREARLLASLNHPNIASIYGLEESDGVKGIAMELVEGPALSDRLLSGPFPLHDTLLIAGQVAEALEAAHEKSIIHRDLKPANVKLTSQGKVKVLDFGLAKALSKNSGGGDSSQSPTITISDVSSRTGVILGTAAYMSPEQARGKPLDRRTDIWSFGCLLYEMLSGKMAFSGETVSDTIAQVLQREPHWEALPGTTPPLLERLLRRCLQKDPQRRFHDIADVRLDLEEIAAYAPDVTGTMTATAALQRKPRSSSLFRASLITLACLLVALGVWIGRRTAPAPLSGVRRVQLSTPFLQLLNECNIDISHDGFRIAYVGEQDGKRQVYVRGMDSTEATPLAGTDNGLCPTFSPDGQWVAFWADQKLQKLSLRGGSPIALYKTNGDLWSLPLKMNWETLDWISFAILQAGGRGQVMRIRTEGGTPESLASADAGKGEYYVFQPELLPDNGAVLFTASAGASFGSYKIVVQSLKTGQRQTLVEGASGAHYTPTGHLLYEQGGKLMAAPFDLKSLKLTGTAVAMVDGLNTELASWGRSYAVSDEGTLAWLPSIPVSDQNMFVWVDRVGTEQPAANVRGSFLGAQISPDGDRVSTWSMDGQVWVLDLKRGVLNRVTTQDQNFWNIWTPGGQQLVYNSARPDSPGTPLFLQNADGLGTPARLTTTQFLAQPRSFSPDGKLLIYQEQRPDTDFDIWALPMEKDATPKPVLMTSFNEFQPKLSPDGRWLAYVSNETGLNEIYVRPFPAMDRKWLISNNGGVEPAWSPDSHELYYRTIESPLTPGLMAVTVDTAQGFYPGKPRFLFKGPYQWVPVYGQSYDVSRDGKRFLLIKHNPPRVPPAANVALNWFEELNRRVPVGK